MYMLFFAAMQSNVYVAVLFLVFYVMSIVFSLCGIKQNDLQKKIKDYVNSLKDLSKQSNNNNNFIPKKYICPITKKIMKHPVVIFDRNVYEKKAIIKWCKNNFTTPSGKKITKNPPIIIPEEELQKEINTFVNKNKDNLKKLNMISSSKY